MLWKCVHKQHVDQLVLVAVPQQPAYLTRCMKTKTQCQTKGRYACIHCSTAYTSHNHQHFTISEVICCAN